MSQLTFGQVLLNKIEELTVRLDKLEEVTKALMPLVNEVDLYMPVPPTTATKDTSDSLSQSTQAEYERTLNRIEAAGYEIFSLLTPFLTSEPAY